MRYLGIVLDGRWSFTEHFARKAPKLLAAAGALGGLLPNTGGPGSTCRRLYQGVVRSMALYGAPIWAESLNARNVALLRRPQRVIATRAIRAYRTVSFEAATLLAGSPPWDLEAGVLAAVYWQVAEERAAGNRPLPEEIKLWREEAKDDLLRRWDERLEAPSASREVVGAVRPVLRDWLKRDFGPMTYHLTQVLTGHGCFGRYLWRVARREDTAVCKHCDRGEEDTAHHTRAVCPAWDEPRSEMAAVLGADLSLPAIASAMVRNRGTWEAVVAFCDAVMSLKEAAEREREDDPLSLPIRRKRTGRRRAAYDRRLPP
ncbi:uncharacterized protein LOC134665486 [Cydia fagiglandana]|uniref:uncharacterized protein LOC134651648 n=3 Tax=Cydia amplana TaxID=1869771 RepID=UPI002FE5946C